MGLGELGKSMPLWGKSALALLPGKKLLVPISAVESPSMKIGGNSTGLAAAAKLRTAINKDRIRGRNHLFSMRKLLREQINRKKKNVLVYKLCVSRKASNGIDD